jgi:hypothetical protein
MKKLLLAAAVLVFLPKAHASCSGVTVTPSTFTLQAGQTQIFTANGGTQCTTSPTWTCSPSGHCGTLSPATASKTTYTAGPTPAGSAETVTITATYPNGSNGSASVSVTAVQINALLPSTTSGTAWTDFQTDVLGNPYVSGLNPPMIWSQFDSGNGSYNFSSYDSTIASYFPNNIPNKKINIIVQGVTGGNAIGGGAPNTATPTYVLTDLGSSNIFYNCNYGQQTTPPAPPGGFPAVWSSTYYSHYQNFIQAVVNWYSPTGSSILANYIGYIRFGLSAGGEVYPFCDGEVTGISDSTWENYAQIMDQYKQNLGSSIQLMTSINQSDNTPITYTLPIDEAYDAQHPPTGKPTLGFGSQGLQIKDTEGGTCTSDWCTLFGSTYNYAGPLELQTVLQSDPNPSGSSQTGSLCKLVPFATYNNAKILELYPWDLLYAYDSGFCALPNSPGTQANPLSDYCCTTGTYNGNSCTVNTPLFSDAYSTSISDAANAVSNPSDTLSQPCSIN